MTQRQRGKELAGRAVADGKVVFNGGDAFEERLVLAGDPPDAQAREPVSLCQRAKRNASLVQIGRRRKPFGLAFQPAVDLVGEQP